jgi:hypothetical protein
LRPGVEPNPLVIARREALLGGAKVHHRTAEDPMLLAFARGWIGELELAAGKSMARLYREAFGSKRIDAAYEAPGESARDGRAIRHMTDIEIVAAFDAILSSTRREVAGDARRVDALNRYTEAAALLSPLAHGEIFSAFVLEAWPQWLIWRVLGGREPPSAVRRYVALRRGLQTLSRGRGLTARRSQLSIVQ